TTTSTISPSLLGGNIERELK
ncbi:unnamed protein product, partial [Allacma fusca]